MKTMKKTMLYLLLAVMLLLPMLAGCNNESANDQNEVPDETTAPVTEEVEEDVDQLQLFVDGASEYVIVRAKDAYITEQTAATELQKYLKQITGVELPIVTDDTAPAKKEIVVGKTNREKEGEFDRAELGDDGIVIKTRSHRLFLTGGEKRGALYAVYEFLESYLGCRFYTASFEKVPENKTIILGAVEEDKQIPTFTQRTVYWTDYLKGSMSGSEFAAKRKINHRRWGSYDEAYGGGALWAGGYPAHSMPYVLSASGLYTRGQPCLSDETIYQCILDWAMTSLAETPDAAFIDVSMADNESYCRCEKCAALEEKHGAYMGVLLTFLNRIAADIAKEYPDVMIHTLAYRGTNVVPTGIKPADNVIVELCTPKECFRHPLNACDDCKLSPYNPFYQTLHGWFELTDTLGIWDYTTNYYNYPLSYPNFEVLRSNIRLFADSGVKCIFEQGNYETVSVEFGELRSYLIAKMLWNPYMTDEEVEALMMEFIMDYYGPGGESIREYIKVMQEESADTCVGMQSNPRDVYDMSTVDVENNPVDTVPEGLTADMIRSYESVNWYQYADWYTIPQARIVSEGDRLFADALAKAETDEQRANIERSFLQVDYLRSYILFKGKNHAKEMVTQLFATGIPAVFPNEFTADELETLRSAITSLMNTQAKDGYIEYNRQLAIRLYEYGANVREGSSSGNGDTQSRNYSKTPDSWLS